MADDLHRIAEPSVRRRTGAHQPSPLDPPRRRSVDHPSHQAPPKLTMPSELWRWSISSVLARTFGSDRGARDSDTGVANRDAKNRDGTGAGWSGGTSWGSPGVRAAGNQYTQPMAS